jgi:[ribosomal protein S18]-alanine N-acetyltransferase
MSLEIFPAEPADFLAIAALDRIAWRHTGEPFIADGEHVWRVWCEYAVVLVARIIGESTDETADVLGATVMFPTATGEWFLHKIMVHPERRGGGVGSALMRAALERANAPVLLTVDPANKTATQLYQSFGFSVRQYVEGYYRPHEHRNVMVYSPAHDG